MITSFPSVKILERWIWRVIVAGVVCIPLVISLSGKDSFRLPKELLFRAEVIVLLAISIVSLIVTKGRIEFRRKDAGMILPAAIVLWSLLCTLTASNRTVSSAAFFWIFGWAIIFVITYTLARDHSIAVIVAAIVPAMVNAIALLLQESALWNPFFPRESEHVFHTALIGNPDDVGTFLVAPVIASCAAAISSTSRRRVIWIAIAVLLLVAALANHTVTALIALAAGLLVMAFLVSRRFGIAATLSICLAAGLVVRYDPPIKTRVELGRAWLAKGEYDTILSGRVLPYLAAVSMFHDHPLTGVGPGCFKWEYFPYKVKINANYRRLVVGWGFNFGEVHNDHLQVLAESGAPGYLLFLTALTFIGAGTIRASATSTEPPVPEASFSRLASLPLAIAFATVALAQFPLELAATTAVNIYLMALCTAWSSLGKRGLHAPAFVKRRRATG